MAHWHHRSLKASRPSSTPRASTAPSAACSAHRPAVPRFSVRNVKELLRFSLMHPDQTIKWSGSTKSHAYRCRLPEQNAFVPKVDRKYGQRRRKLFVSNSCLVALATPTDIVHKIFEFMISSPANKIGIVSRALLEKTEEV